MFSIRKMTGGSQSMYTVPYEEVDELWLLLHPTGSVERVQRQGHHGACSELGLSEHFGVIRRGAESEI